MKIAVFTSNQARHLSLIKSLSAIATEVVAVTEVATIFPGQTADFYNNTDVMKDYFTQMLAAEKKVFGRPDFLPTNVKVWPIKLGDINNIPVDWFKNEIEDVDYVVVFGASWIKGELFELILKKKAINIHMGVSPYYRGTACNFWALYENKPDYVGATIHYLSKGLDSGAMIMHCLPQARPVDGFELGMLAVQSAHQGLCTLLKSGEIFNLKPEIQDKTKQIRYSKKAEFSDTIASEYLKNPPTQDFIFQKCQNRDLTQFLRPFLY